MENLADIHVDLSVQPSGDELGHTGDEAAAEDSLSGASTDAYESNEDVEEYVSDDDGTSNEDTTLEALLGEESAQILRLAVVYTRELGTQIVNSQALLNRLRTRLVRHSYGRNTCNREDHLYSLFLLCQYKLEDKKEMLRTTNVKLDEVRHVLALQGIDLE